MSIHMFFGVVLTQVVSLVLSVQTTCDIRYDKTLEGLEADCSKRSLKSVPKNLPINIVALNLDGNAISKITNGVFASFSNLKSLKLSHNKVEDLEKDAFHGLHNLVELDLAANRYFDNGSYPQGVFDPVHNLISLSVEGDVRSGNVFPGYIFQPLSKLTKLCIFTSYSSVLNECKTFSSLSSLNSLRFRSHSQNCLKNDTFICPEFLSLHKLTIGCMLYMTEKCSFCPLKNLTYLKIHTNAKSDITLKGVTKSLYGFTNRNSTLNEIDLYGVQDTKTPRIDITLDRQVMGYLPGICVKRLDLSNNRLMIVKAEAFQDNDRITMCIQYLDLSRNYIKFVLFERLYFNFFLMNNLKVIDISQNANRFSPENDIPPVVPFKYGGREEIFLDTVHGFILPLPPKIEYLNLSKSGNDFSFKYDLTFRNGENLRGVDLSNNRLLDSPAHMYGLSNISYLDISEMEVRESVLTNTDMFTNVETLIAHDTTTFPLLLTSEDSIFFLMMTKLTQLDLSGNGLQIISQRTFSRLVSVITLKLSRNHLSYIPGELLNMPSLTSLDLSFNSISMIRNDEQERLDMKLEQQGQFYLDIFGNSITCTCHTLGFVKWLHETRINLRNKGNYSCLTDYGAITNTAQFYNDILLHWRRCVGQIWLSVAVFLHCFLIICLLFAFLLKKYFPKVEYHILGWLGLLEPQRWRYKYDAYICYDDNEYQWPIHCLFKDLKERDKSMRLYLPDLHDDIGAAVADVICDVISESWKLVIVVTEDLFSDEWLHFKVLEALAQFSQDGVIASRILLLYQDISLEAQAMFPKVLLNVVPSKNILHVKSGDDFWTELHQMIINEDLNIEVLF